MAQKSEVSLQCHYFRGNSKMCSYQAACPGCPNRLRGRGTTDHSWVNAVQQDPRAASNTPELACQGAHLPRKLMGLGSF